MTIIGTIKADVSAVEMAAQKEIEAAIEAFNANISAISAKYASINPIVTIEQKAEEVAVSFMHGVEAVVQDVVGQL